MKVIGYGRVSSVGQEDGDGYPRQEAAIRAFCERHGLEIHGLSFEAVSGTVDGMDRPKLREELAEHEAGNSRVEAIVIERLDRLARDLFVQELLIRELQKRGIKLFSCDQGELMNLAEACPDPTRKLIRQVLGAVAEFEKTNLVRKLHAARVRTGHMGGSKPYGDSPVEAPVLEAMLGLRETLSLRGLADALNNSGFTKRNGKPWSHSAVGLVLANHDERKARSL